MSEPATPTTTVLDVVADALAERLVGCLLNTATAVKVVTDANAVLRALGLDPGMSVERLRADLDIAQRARAALPVATKRVDDASMASYYGVANGMKVRHAQGCLDCLIAVLGDVVGEANVEAATADTPEAPRVVELMTALEESVNAAKRRRAADIPDNSNDPYTPEAMRAAGFQSQRITPPLGLSGAMYIADADDADAIEVWWRAAGTPGGET